MLNQYISSVNDVIIGILEFRFVYKYEDHPVYVFITNGVMFLKLKNGFCSEFFNK